MTASHTGDTLKEMEHIFPLEPYGAQLWTRERGSEIRAALEAVLDTLAPGEVVVLDLEGVEVFDFSFANELFGRTLLRLPDDHPDRFVVVAHLNEYTRLNLSQALASLGLLIIEREGGAYHLLGKAHAADKATVAVLIQADRPVSAAELASALGVQLTAMNERLAKLARLAIVWRQKATSPAGREQYLYVVPS